jgi:hypothetical protein
MSNSEKALYLINAERVVRGLLPLEAVSSNIVTIAQTYATFLLTNDKWGHDKNGSPSDRLNGDAAINGIARLASFMDLRIFLCCTSGPPIPLMNGQSTVGSQDAVLWGHRNTCAFI